MTVPPHLSGLTDRAGKDIERESELAALNDLLSSVEATVQRQHATPARTLVFVIGPPRSGTTLASQIIAASGSFGFADNVVARFWKAPALGVMISRALSSPARDLDYQSVRGVTKGDGSPHEFGYFWSSWFDLGQETHKLSDAERERVDLPGLKRALAAMEATARKPFMFKNNTWLTFQADWLASAFPKSVFVACERDPFFVAQSLYEQRLALFDDPTRWWSVRPPSFAALCKRDPFEQTAAQALEIAREMDRALGRVPASRIVRLPYRELCAAPRDAMAQITACCRLLGESIDAAYDRIPKSFEHTDVTRLDAASSDRLHRAIDALRID